MAIRVEKSGELLMIYGKKDDEPDVQKEWSARRRKLGTFCAAVAIVATVFVLGPHMPGWALLSGTFKTIVTAIW
ncbi:MAG TPA: hypothetical protein VFZ27_07565 [Terriglobia bacterium]|nr:hypothetical protein [Terriglobia bacterium]